jgi:peptidoglycan/LPS O-acetylase OafA/YrhL
MMAGLTMIRSPGAQPSSYLEGLHGLRFAAAFFVLLAHAYETVIKSGLARPLASSLALFDRGRAAVDFFFTLSGFLITYLLIRELDATGRISLKRFYFRRVCRIWPLYFLVLGIGFVVFAVVYPLAFHQTYFQFNLGHGLLLYVFFLPNLMASLYKVGMLNPLWSIGVEEQFYLCWAPLVKMARRRLLLLVLAAVALTVTFYALWGGNRPLDEKGTATFLHTLRFHYMAAGSVFAWVLARAREAYARSLFATRAYQWVNVLALGYYYVVGFSAGPYPWMLDLPLALLYGTLILNVSVIPDRILDLERRPLVYLGAISYGIYMYHMAVDYLLRLVLARYTFVPSAATVPIVAAYAVLLLGVTVAVAHVSYRHFESHFIHLRLPDRRRGKVAVSPAAVAPELSPSIVRDPI